MKNLTDDFIQSIVATNAQAKQIRDIVSLTRMRLGFSSFSKIRRHYTLDTKIDNEKIYKKLIEYGFIRCKISSGDIIYILDDTKSDCVKVVINIRTTTEYMSVQITGDKELSDELHSWLEQEFVENGIKINTIIGVSDKGIIQHDSNFLHLNEIQQAKQCFYPFLDISLEEYFSAFMASNENILVLFGAAGTGKSTFIRTLIAHGKYESTLVYDHNLVCRSEIINAFLNDYPDRILIYEDIDKYLGKREDGNGLMSSFLNASDGIIKKKNKKIIFSTNLPTVDRIDPALIRVGRCFDILKFDHLNREQSNIILSEMNLPSKDFSAKEKWTLSEVLSTSMFQQQKINRFGRSVGFK